MKVLKRLLVLAVVGAILITSLVGCSSTGKKMMEIADSEMTGNLFMLLMSRTKGNLAASLGTQVLKDSFWDTIMDAQTGKTYNDHYTDLVLSSAKNYLASLYLF